MSIMAAVLESPMEALAINYMSVGVFTAVNNVWAWIAVVTAAISFWKIKSSVSPSPSPSPRSPSTTNSSDLLSEALKKKQQQEASINSGACLSPSSSITKRIKKNISSPLESTIGTTSGKFTVYYKEHGDDSGTAAAGVNAAAADVTEDNEQMMSDTNINGGGGGERSKLKHGSDTHDGWEAMLRMKSGEKEWYRYQDLSLLHGNVVRLWDDNHRPYSSSSSSCWTTTSTIVTY